MSPRSYTDEQVEFIRSKASDHTDPQIGALMGWPAWKVLHVRTRHDIPTIPKDAFWSAERIEELRRLLVVDGLSSNVIAERFGVNGSTIRKAVRRYGFVRNPIEAQRQMLESVRRAGQKGGAARWDGHEPKAPTAKPETVRERRHFGNGAFSPSQRDREPLPDRILRALAERPMSAATLASLTGDKEAYVSLQLSALAHDGRVRAGEGGPRERRWSLAA